MSIESQLEEVFRTTFGQPDLKLVRELSPHSVDGWDSLAHVRLIMAVERRFALKIKTTDLFRLKKAGDFIDFLKTSLPAS